MGLPGSEIVDVDLLPIGASGVLNDRDITVVVACAAERSGHCSVFTQGVGVEEQLVLSVQLIAHIPDALVLQTVVF